VNSQPGHAVTAKRARRPAITLLVSKISASTESRYVNKVEGLDRFIQFLGGPSLQLQLWLESMLQSFSHPLDCISMVLTATCKTALPQSRAGAPNCLALAFNFQTSQFSSGISWTGILDFGDEAVWSQQVTGGRWA